MALLSGFGAAVGTDLAAMGVTGLPRPTFTGTAWKPRANDVRRRFSKGVTCSWGGRLQGVCRDMLVGA